MAFKLRMVVNVCMTYWYAHVRFDDLDLVLDFENVCKARPTCFFLSLFLHFPSAPTKHDIQHTAWNDCAIGPTSANHRQCILCTAPPTLPPTWTRVEQLANSTSKSSACASRTRGSRYTHLVWAYKAAGKARRIKYVFNLQCNFRVDAFCVELCSQPECCGAHKEKYPEV